MKKYHLYYVLTFFLGISGTGHAQSYQEIIDSLHGVYRETEDPLTRTDLLNEIAYAYRRSSPDSVLTYAQKAISLADRNDYDAGLAYGYKNMGIAHYKFDSGADTIIYYYEKAIAYAEVAEDYYTQAACYNNIGLIKSFGLSYNEAARYFLQGLSTLEKHSNEESRLKALMLGNLGTSYHRGGDNQRGIAYYERSLAMAERLGELSIPSIFVDELARARMEEGDLEGALRDVLALMPLHDQIGDYESKGETMMTLSEIKMNMKAYEEAVEHGREALVLSRTHGFPRMESTALIQIANGLAELGQVDAAIEHIEQALKIESVGLTLSFQAKATGRLADLYTRRGDYEQAYRYAIRYGELITKDQDANKHRISNELEAKYQNEEKLRQIERLEKERKEQQLRFYGLSILTLLFLLGLGILIRAIRQKNRVTQTLNEKNTALAAAEKSLHDKNEQLERYIESNLQLENFAHLASHDLREPMRNIVSFSQLLARSAHAKLTEREREYLDFIQRGTRRIEGMVQDLLNYSIVTHSPLKKRVFSLRKLISEVETDLGPLLRETKGEIVVEDLPATLEADRGRMHQLLQNLFANALRYRREGVPPVVTVSGEELPEEYYLRVSDNGVGIPAEFYEQIFILFKTLKNKSITQSSGIGLATCKRITEDHGGKIWVESEIERGSTFHFTIRKDI